MGLIFIKLILRIVLHYKYSPGLMGVKHCSHLIISGGKLILLVNHYTDEWSYRENDSFFVLRSFTRSSWLSVSHWSTHTVLYSFSKKLNLHYFLTLPLCIRMEQVVQASQGDDRKKVCVDRQPVFGLSLMVARVHMNAIKHSLTLFSPFRVPCLLLHDRKTLALCSDTI